MLHLRSRAASKMEVAHHQVLLFLTGIRSLFYIILCSNLKIFSHFESRLRVVLTANRMTLHTIYKKSICWPVLSNQQSMLGRENIQLPVKIVNFYCVFFTLPPLQLFRLDYKIDLNSRPITCFRLS